jgi:hypothetical protein
MKKLKDIIKTNKDSLEDYLSSFEPSVRENYINIFKDSDFEKGCTSFIQFMRTKIAMPKIGKNTLRYWTSRGWSEEKSEELRVKLKSNPENSPMNINFWIKRGFSKEDSLFRIKSQRKMNIEYWLNKGYSEEESSKKRLEFQNKSSESFIIKYNTDFNFKNRVDSKRTNNIQYWLNKGYSEEESRALLSNRQRTFSKNICIEKYGTEYGILIWEERQKKWLKSLNESNYDLSSGKSVTIKDKIERYDIDKLLDSLTLKNKDFFKKIFKKSDTIEDFIKNYMDNFDIDEVSLYRLLLPIKRLKLLHEYYNTTNSYIMSLIIPKITRIKSSYSYISWINNHVCRSDGEYIIANFLLKNDIDYIYEKRYDNSKYKCDFYLIKSKTYIEYLGMKINVYENKLKFLKEKKIKHIASNDIEYIKNKIKQEC